MLPDRPKKKYQTSDEREKKIYQASQEYGYTLKEITNYFGKHYTTISKIIKKVENKGN